MKCPKKSVLEAGISVVVMAMSWGCAGPTTYDGQSLGSAESLRPGYDVAYCPDLRSDVTLSSVQDRISQIGGRNSKGVFVSDDPPQFESWTILRRMAINNDRIEIEKGSDVYNNGFFVDSSITISPSGYQPKSSTSVRLFSYNLSNRRIVVEKSRAKGYYPYVIFINDVMAFRFHRGDLAGAKTTANALYVLQQSTKDQDTPEKKLARFESIAAQYRALAVKPEVSEEQRKYIVQANALTEQKQFEKAREKYRQVIELDPTSYPTAYFNMALLAVQEHDPVTAIFRMKQYLLLVPDAQDARSAQDKIYEWELMLNK